MSFENWKRLLREVEEMRQQDKDKKKANKGKAKTKRGGKNGSNKTV